MVHTISVEKSTGGGEIETDAHDKDSIVKDEVETQDNTEKVRKEVVKELGDGQRIYMAENVDNNRERQFLEDIKVKRVSGVLDDNEVQENIDDNSMQFMIGVVNAFLTLYIFAAHSYIFPYFYTIKLFALVGYRFYVYWFRSWHWFLLDYCYFVNWAWMVYLWIIPSKYFFVMLFSLNLSLLFACVIFGNALIFHSIDHTTSVLIHLSPNLLSYSLRWNQDKNPDWHHDMWETCDPSDGECMNIYWFFIYPVCFIVCFMLQYWFWEQIVFRRFIEADPNAQTTFKWLTRKKEKSTIYNIVNVFGPRFQVLIFGLGMITLNSTLVATAYPFYISEWANGIVIALTAFLLTRNGSILYGKAVTKSQILDIHQYLITTTPLLD